MNTRSLGPPHFTLRQAGKPQSETACQKWHDQKANNCRQMPSEAQPAGFDRTRNQRQNRNASKAEANSAATNAGASSGRMPENVRDKVRAIVTAGLANDVDAVNQ